MPDNTSPLLVPVGVDALIVNKLVQNAVVFHRWQNDYSQVPQFQSAVPAPFSDEISDPPDPGVHLHWSLPRALTRGTQVQATATAEVSGGQLTGLTVTNGGYGYSNLLPPVVTIVGQSGSGALATAVVTNGIVTGINIVSAGTGYTDPPQVTIAPSQAFSYPYVPNRWLIVRYSPGESATQPRQTMAWLLQSDSLNPDTSAWDSNSFVNPFPSTPGTIEPTMLGTKATVLQSWVGEEGEPQQLFLQALGPGDATFSAYQPGLVNVFSFYDPINDPNASSNNPNYQDAATFPENTALSYLIIGWYSDPTHDPLYGPVTSWDEYGNPTRSPWTGEANPSDAWQSLMNDLGWTVEDASGQTNLPSQSVYHASVYDVVWQTTTVPTGVTEVDVTDGGTGYTTAPDVVFAGGGGAGAAGVAQVENGAVVSVILTSGGASYTSAPSVSFTGGGGTGAAATAQIWNNINGMTVAVGNSSIDALAAIVQKYADTEQHGALEAELLEAFQYNFLKTLDDADGEAQLDLKIRQASFASVPGGTLWEVVAAQTEQTPTGQLSPDAVPPPPPLTEAQAEKLAKLNRDQRALDQATQLLASMQWELYATWWKNSWINANMGDFIALNTYFDTDSIQQAIQNDLDPGNDSGLYASVVARQQSVQTQMQALPNPTDPLSILDYATNTLGLDPAELQLKAATMPRFYQPADPVVLVSGIQSSDKQGSLDGGGSLFCRFLSQAVTGVNVESGGNATQVTSATSGIQQVIPVVSNSHLPAAVTAGIGALSVETFFVDPNNATTIVQVGLNSTDAGTIAGLYAGMVTQTAQVATISDPLAAYAAFSLWATQAWSPLYMQWKVTFSPTLQNNQLQQDGTYDNWPLAKIAFDSPPATSEQPCWSFNGKDFDWYGGFSMVGPPNGQLYQAEQTYIGRTFLTPQSTYVFIARLKKYLADNPNADLEAAKKLIDTIGDWDFLSQRLSGLVDMLIMRDLGQSPPPDSSISEQVGEEYKAIPDPTKGNQDTAYGGGMPFFLPVRGGFLQFVKLVVVDAFGQVVDLMSAGGNTGTGVSFAPVRGRGLAPMQATQLPYPSELVQLSPRMAQAARLDFRFISATNDQQETGLYTNSSPVCGWVLPNHLDGGLSVYDADGNAVGELMVLVDTQGNKDVRWLPAPDSPAAVSDPTKITNQHLSKFVLGFTSSTDQGQGFKDFLQAVDETLWTFEPLGSRADQNLSVLIGRPLALLRAQLQLELQGRPVYNQSWPDTGLQQTAAVETIQFPVRLGSTELYNDGLMGYYLDDNYSTFNSVHQPKSYQPTSGSYLNPVGYNGNYIQLQFNYPSYATQYITMLLDPRGDAHAFTGILPVKIVSLPASYFEDALARMAVTFRTGPVITDADAIRIPLPTEKNGTWSWLERNSPADPQNWTDPAGWDVLNIVKADQSARLPEQPPRLVEGWLKLTPTDIEK
ncbi:MAG TPA: hypothetical protein VJS44_06115 [Pyrinomonadaceae bacterium]|nr:hypothetical protein [Pyrinomonadaceae bacterium]